MAGFVAPCGGFDFDWYIFLESWREFVSQLSSVLRVEEGCVWRLLCSYLATEFRGTSESLKELLKDHQQVRASLSEYFRHQKFGGF